MFGIPMEGEPQLQSLMNVHFRSPALAARLVAAGREAMLYFVFNAQVGAARARAACWAPRTRWSRGGGR